MFRSKNFKNTEQSSTIAPSKQNSFYYRKNEIYCPQQNAIASDVVNLLKYKLLNVDASYSYRYVVVNLTRPTPDLKIPYADEMKGFFEICGFNQDTPKILNALAAHCFT